jgi:hypothetical protein
MVDNNIDHLAASLTEVLEKYIIDEPLPKPSPPGALQSAYQILKVVALLLDG